MRTLELWGRCPVHAQVPPDRLLASPKYCESRLRLVPSARVCTTSKLPSLPRLSKWIRMAVALTAFGSLLSDGGRHCKLNASALGSSRDEVLKAATGAAVAVNSAATIR